MNKPTAEQVAQAEALFAKITAAYQECKELRDSVGDNPLFSRLSQIQHNLYEATKHTQPTDSTNAWNKRYKAWEAGNSVHMAVPSDFKP